MKEKAYSRQLALPFITEDKPVARDPKHRTAESVPSEEITGKDLVNGRLLVKEVCRTMENSSEEGRNVRCVPTGIAALDHFLTGGLHCSDLITIAARPSIGKTSVVTRIAKNVAVEYGIPVFIFTPEMTGQELMLKMLSSVSKVPLRRLKTLTLDERQWCPVTVACSKISDASIFIDDTVNLSFPELKNKALKIKELNKSGLIIVDGFQFMPPMQPRLSRDDELKDLIRSFKGLAIELDVPVLLTSYLDRKVDERMDKRPILSDLAISGLDEFADLVLFLYRKGIPDKDQVEAALHMLSVSVAKNRHGALGTLEIMTDDCLEDVSIYAQEAQLIH